MHVIFKLSHCILNSYFCEKFKAERPSAFVSYIKSVMSLTEIQAQLQQLKEEKNAVILAHYYQIPEVQDLADHIGDSFALSKLAADLPHEVIVFCGVHFMAETAKTLSPEKTVLLPAKDAGCPMADMATLDDVLKLKKAHPDAAVVSYVNSTTGVKSESDICCTSANAIKVIRSLPHAKIIFLPDENLGSYVAEHVPEKEFVLFKGYCPTHEEVMAIDVQIAREENPNALLLVHPECRPEVRELADFVGSTGQIINYVAQSTHKSFIIGTELGILHPLQTRNPQKNFVMLTAGFLCPNMKKTTPEHVFTSLQSGIHRIEMDPQLMEKARLPLKRMLEVK